MIPHSADDISKRLMATLEHEPRVNLHRNPISVSVQDGSVRLEGTVESIVVKKTAATAAQRVANGLPILDRLRVAVTAPMEDGALRVKVLRELLEEPAFTEYRIRARRNGSFETLRDRGDDVRGNIDVSVANRVVTLEGLAGSLTHRRLAEVLLWWTAGCEDVDNRLRVTPAEQEHEGELIDAVRIVLEKDPLVHASQLHVSARHKTVTLAGYVVSREERRLAVLDTWYVPGVRNVVDRIATQG